jgi:hypothetical protein
MYIIKKKSVYENFYNLAYISYYMELQISTSDTLGGRVGVNFIVCI